MVFPLIFLCQYRSLVIDQNAPQNRAARESAEKIIDLKFTNHRSKLNDKDNERNSNDDRRPSKLITDLETEELNVIDQGTKHIASQILNSELSKSKKSDDELDQLMDQLITSEVVDKLYDDIMKRLENSQDTRNIFCEKYVNGNFLKKSGVYDSNNENNNNFETNDMNDASNNNNFDEVDGLISASSSQFDLTDTTKPEIKNDIKNIMKDAFLENPRLFNFGGSGQSVNFQQQKQSLNTTSVIQDILLKSAGVFVVVGLMAMALINIKANKRQKGIPRNENSSETSNQTELNRGDSHENSHLQSTLFLNHQDRDSRNSNLQSVSTVSNSC